MEGSFHQGLLATGFHTLGVGIGLGISVLVLAFEVDFGQDIFFFREIKYQVNVGVEPRGNSVANSVHGLHMRNFYGPNSALIEYALGVC